jgi:hypothetical protein
MHHPACLRLTMRGQRRHDARGVDDNAGTVGDPYGVGSLIPELLHLYVDLFSLGVIRRLPIPVQSVHRQPPVSLRQ